MHLPPNSLTPIEQRFYWASLLLPQVDPLAVAFHLDFRYGMDLPYRCPLTSNHRNVLVVVEEPPTDPHRHILVHHSIQVRLRPLVDRPGSSCCFNDDSLADVVDARGVARVHVPINFIWIRESAVGRLGALRLDLVNEEALNHERRARQVLGMVRRQISQVRPIDFDVCGVGGSVSAVLVGVQRFLFAIVAGSTSWAAHSFPIDDKRLPYGIDVGRQEFGYGVVFDGCTALSSILLVGPLYVLRINPP